MYQLLLYQQKIMQSDGFERPICWNEYKVIDNKIVEIAAANEEKYIRELLDSSWQEVKKILCSCL